MSKNIFVKTVASAILLVSGVALAGSDYPAADFQPKVVYSDDSAVQAAKSAAPASKPAEVVVENDPNFPAANFQPKVVFADANYKHDSTAPGVASPAKSAAASSVVESSEAAVVVSEKVGSESSNSTFMIVMLVGAAGVFFLYNKKQAPASVGGGSSDVVASGATGVEKYLDKMGANKTGVAKYLEKQGTTTATGVARYMAKQIVRDREAAAARATGVEKYLRDKV